MDRNALDPGDDVLGRALARNPSNEDLQLAWLTEIARRSQLVEANAPGPFRQAAPNLMAFVDRIPMALSGLRAGPLSLQRFNALAHEKAYPYPEGEPAIQPGMSTAPLRASTFRNVDTARQEAGVRDVRFPGFMTERHPSGATRSRQDNDNPGAGWPSDFPTSGPGFNVRGGYGSSQAALDGPQGHLFLARLRQRIADETRKDFQVLPGDKKD